MGVGDVVAAASQRLESVEDGEEHEESPVCVIVLALLYPAKVEPPGSAQGGGG